MILTFVGGTMAKKIKLLSDFEIFLLSMLAAAIYISVVSYYQKPDPHQCLFDEDYIEQAEELRYGNQKVNSRPHIKNRVGRGNGTNVR
jgi:hypothetical protein